MCHNQQFRGIIPHKFGAVLALAKRLAIGKSVVVALALCSPTPPLFFPDKKILGELLNPIKRFKS